MQQIDLNIKFITPLLIHGADGTSPDHLGLGKALRGAWRFWFRAIVGGAIGEDQLVSIKGLEELVFGSTNTGKFRLFVAADSDNLPTAEFPRLPHKDTRGKKAWSQGFQEGSIFTVTILPRMPEYEIDPLFAAIWLWGNLGACGNRSRRGFGAPVLENVGSSGCFAEHGLSLTPSFSDRDSLHNHLKDGVEKAWQIICEWLKQNGYTPQGTIMGNSFPNESSFFILNSLEQIGISSYDLSLIIRDNAVSKVHGARCDALGYAKGSNRMASPVFTRFYKIDNSYVPVATWTKPQHVPQACYNHGNCVNAYLNDIGINTNLAGGPV